MPRRFEQHSTQVIPPQAKLGRIEWLLSRPLYRFGRFDLKAVPRQQRSAALELQIRQWTPYAESGRFTAWEGDDALVWAWDAARVRSAQAEYQLGAGRVRVLPETLLRQKHEHGIHLNACLEGYEGQIWQDGSLRFSRWWPELPVAAEWLNFQRDAGIPPEQQQHTAPAALPPDWQERPWARQESPGSVPGTDGRSEMLVVALGTAVLTLTTFWYAASYFKLRHALGESMEQLSELEARAEPIRQARGQALDEMARVNTLLAADAQPDPLVLMAKVAKLLPGNGAYLKEWEYQGGKLKIMIAFPVKPVSSQYVNIFQSAGMFENVQASVPADPNDLVLTMELSPHAEIRLDETGAEPAGADAPHTASGTVAGQDLSVRKQAPASR